MALGVIATVIESVKVGSATEVTTTVTLPSFNAVKEKEELAAQVQPEEKRSA